MSSPFSPAETLAGAPAAEVSVVQSGQSHWSVEARVSGRTARQDTCHGVTHVLQVSFSSSDGLVLQSMQMPSPSHGNWLTCAIGVSVSKWMNNNLIERKIDLLIMYVEL